MLRLRREAAVANPLGLHLRAADQFVRLAQAFQSEVRVLHDGRTADGKSILDLTFLAAEFGTRLELEVHGPDADTAIAALAELLETDTELSEAADHTPVGDC